jgi:hypothetical protein
MSIWICQRGIDRITEKQVLNKVLFGRIEWAGRVARVGVMINEYKVPVGNSEETSWENYA